MTRDESKTESLFTDMSEPVDSLDDLRAVAPPVLRHRVLVNFQAEADGIDAETIRQDAQQPTIAIPGARDPPAAVGSDHAEVDLLRLRRGQRLRRPPRAESRVPAAKLRHGH